MRVRKAQSLVKSGNVDGAEAALAEILEQHPSNARAQQAMKRLREQIRTANEPDPADQQRISGLVAAGQYADAFATAKELVGTHPKSVYLWNILGTMCLKFDDPAASEPCFKRAVTLDPAVSAPLIGLAAARKLQGAGTEAIALLEMALERDPRHLAAQKQLASLYAEIACHDVALEAFRRVVDLDPDNPGAVSDVAVTLSKLKRYGEALDLVEDLTGRWPGREEDFALGGEIANSAGRYPEAIAWFERVPDHDSDDLATLNILKARGQIADWREFEAQPRKAARIGRQRRAINPGPVLSLVDDPILQLGHAERASAAGFPQVAGPSPAPATERPRRLRIGYFSSDFEDHATMVLMGGLFEIHDRDRFEIFVYSYGPECDRPVRQRLVDAAEHFRDVRKTTDSELAEMARADGIDIAIDLKGYTEGSRSALFAHRLAPVQISWLGWPGTMGHECFDYAIVDRVTVPETQRIGFSENLIYMPDTYQVNDSSRQVPGVALARAEYGLPEDGFVFCCFNATYKITPREFDIWMRLLDRVEGSVLWLLEIQRLGRGQPPGRGGAARHLRRPAGLRGPGQSGGAPGAARCGGPVPRHLHHQCPHHLQRRAVGRIAGGDAAGPAIRGAGRGEPSACRRPARARRKGRGRLRADRAGPRAGSRAARGAEGASRLRAEECAALRHRALRPASGARVRHGLRQASRRGGAGGFRRPASRRSGGFGMIVCHPLKLIFLKTKKVGGTSFEIALSRFCGPDCVITPISPSDEEIRAAKGFPGAQNHDRPGWPDGSRSAGRFYNHISAAAARRMIPRGIWESYTRLSIVRDPHDVAISRYFWEGGPRMGLDFGQFVSTCRAVLSENGIIAPHEGAFAADRFLRYEHLEEDIRGLDVPGLWETFAAIRTKADFRPRTGARPADMYARFPAAAEIVAEQCPGVLERFGYSRRTAPAAPAIVPIRKPAGKAVFALSAGRTGTAYLAKLLGRNLKVEAIHEPLGIDDFDVAMPSLRTMRAFNTFGMDAHVRGFWARKLATLEGTHVETNHTLGKCGLVEALAESTPGERATVIVLRRDLADQCASYALRGDFTNVTLEWQWYLSPAYPNVMVRPDAFLPMGPVGRGIWYALEMEARQAFYLLRYGDRLDFVEARLEDLTTRDGAARLLGALGHEGEVVLPERSNASGGDRETHEALKTEMRRTLAGIAFDPVQIARSYIAKNRVLSSPLLSGAA